MIGAAFTGDAKVNLDLDLGLGDSAAFPRMLADFGLDWSFAGADPGAAGPFGDRPRVAFDNIQLDLGQLCLTTSSGRWCTPSTRHWIRFGRCSMCSTPGCRSCPDLGPTRALLDTNGDGSSHAARRWHR